MLTNVLYLKRVVFLLIIHSFESPCKSVLVVVVVVGSAAKNWHKNC